MPKGSKTVDETTRAETLAKKRQNEFCKATKQQETLGQLVDGNQQAAYYQHAQAKKAVKQAATNNAEGLKADWKTPTEHVEIANDFSTKAKRLSCFWPFARKKTEKAKAKADKSQDRWQNAIRKENLTKDERDFLISASSDDGPSLS